MIKTLIAAAMFVFPIALIGLWASRCDDWATGIAFLTAFVSAVVAIWLRKTQYFEKDAVDLIYYIVVLVGVLVVFAQEGTLRAVQKVEDRIADVSENSKRLHNLLSEYGVLEGQRIDLRAAIKAAPSALTTQIREALIAKTIRLSTADSLMCAEARGFKLDFSQNLPFERLDDFTVMPPPQIVADATCKNAEILRDGERQIARATPLTLGSLKDDPDRFAPVWGETVTVDGQRIRIGLVVDLLLQTDEAGYQILQTKTLEAATAADVLLEALKNSRDTDIEAANGNFKPFFWWLRYKGWPYVLIWLISLKLARRREPSTTLAGGSFIAI